jgi:hypothetical protein
MIRALIISALLTGCATPFCPKTVGCELGTSVRHEVGESPVKITSGIVKINWELWK